MCVSMSLCVYVPGIVSDYLYVSIVCIYVYVCFCVFVCMGLCVGVYSCMGVRFRRNVIVYFCISVRLSVYVFHVCG
jgi:hypothetical protein